jgi:hypothetical protein
MTILFTTVATMIQTSMNMTGASLDDAIEMQEQTVNAIIASGGNLEGDEKDLIFTYEINGVAASANHVVIEGEKNGVTYFEPKRQ